MFEKRKARIEAAVEREKERFSNAKTPEGERIKTADTVLMAVVFILTLLLISVAPKDMPLVHLGIFGAAVAILSKHGRPKVLPVFYSLVARKFNWPSYDDAVRIETEAREKAKEPKTPEGPSAAPVPSKTLSSIGKDVLETFFNMTKENRKEGLARVLEYLERQGFTFPELAEATDEDERFGLAVVALRRLAKENGISAS